MDEDEYDENQEFSNDENNENKTNEINNTNGPNANKDFGLSEMSPKSTRIALPPEKNITDDPLDSNNINDTPTFESIKNHFNSMKKSKHIRKTSSAKSQDFKKSQKTRASQKSRSSSKQRKRSEQNMEEISGGFTNLAYEIEFKNSDECELPIQESSQDLTTSINEDGEYFSKC